MDDDIMLNVVRNNQKEANVKNNTGENSGREGKMSKTDIKRMKYANKLKQKSKYSKNKQMKGEGETSLSKMKTFLNNAQNIKEENHQSRIKKQRIDQQPLVKIQNKDKSIEKTYKINPKVRREKDIIKQQQNHHEIKKQQVKRMKTEQNIPFRPDLRKDITVTELMPEKVQTSIDTNNLESFNIEPKLQDSLIKSGVNKMTQIQVKSYESLVNGVDSVIKASTGSGKTLAYLIPLVNRLIRQKIITKREDGTFIMVICPTRQLCMQGQKQANRCLKRCSYIVPGCLFGGQQTNHQKSRLRKGTNILFCTPGRVLYHLEQTKSFKLNNLQCIVFEEADRTLDMGFQQTIHKILGILREKLEMTHQHKILVSAHFNSKVSNLLEELQMKEPHFIGFENIDQNMQLSKLKQSKDTEINTSAQLKQQYVLMSQQQKIPLMLAYLGVLKNCKALIFVSTIDEVQFIDYLLTNLKYRDSNGNNTQIRFENRPIFKIHGNLDQKLRSKTYLEFRESKEAILISTEVASRGLDFPDLSHIILFDVPPTITDYGNRVGRCARFNQSGVSLLMLHYIESDYAQKIRYYVSNLQVIEKDIIYQSFEKILKSMNIGDSSLHYIEGLVRNSVKNDQEKYMIARKAYVSMLRAYARLPDRQIFAVKKLNLKLLARSFGLNNAQADNNYNPKAKSSHLEASRKKRKVQDVKKIQVSQYL